MEENDADDDAMHSSGITSVAADIDAERSRLSPWSVLLLFAQASGRHCLGRYGVPAGKERALGFSRYR